MEEFKAIILQLMNTQKAEERIQQQQLLQLQQQQQFFLQFHKD